MRVLFSGATCFFSTGKMAKRSCGASSLGKPWKSTSRDAVRTNSKSSEPTDSPSSRRSGGNILLATPNSMGPFSFARGIYLSDDLRVRHGSCPHHYLRSSFAQKNLPKASPNTPNTQECFCRVSAEFPEVLSQGVLYAADAGSIVPVDGKVKTQVPAYGLG